VSQGDRDARGRNTRKYLRDTGTQLCRVTKRRKWELNGFEQLEYRGKEELKKTKIEDGDFREARKGNANTRIVHIQKRQEPSTAE